MNSIYPPYKIHLFHSNGEPKKILVFRGEENKEEIFSKNELDEFEKRKIEIQYSEQEIHKDDSIRILKNKIIYFKHCDFFNA